jgi:phosphatidylglycerophosphate synthase
VSVDPAPIAADRPPPVIVRATVAEAAGARQIVAGLSVLERSLRQLARTPDRRIIVATDGTVPLPRRMPRGVEVRHLGPDVDAALRAVATETGGVTVGADVVRVGREPVDRGMRVIDGTAAVIAEDRIFADLLRGDLGFVARHLNKKISFPVTRFALCRWPFTPNQVTLGAAAVGLLGCVLISSGFYWATVFGFLLAQAQSILDGCDGELARVRFQQSRIGEWLDTLVDDFLNLAIIVSLTLGLWHAAGSPLAIAGGVLAAAMYAFYNVVSYRELVRQGVGGELINIRWKITRGRNMKGMVTEPGSGRWMKFALTLGRRDTFVLGWLGLAILHLTSIALLWAFVAAIPCFAAAVAQVVIKEELPPT